MNSLGLLFTAKHLTSVPFCEPENHGHFRPHTHQNMIYCINQYPRCPNSPCTITDCLKRLQQFFTFWFQVLELIKRSFKASNQSKHHKTLKQSVTSSRIKPLPHGVCQNSSKPVPTSWPRCVEQLSFLLQRIPTVRSPSILKRSCTLSN